jgi:hypothetical protein
MADLKDYRDDRWPLLCFCPCWKHDGHGSDMTDAEYDQRLKMVTSRVGAAPAHMDRWHGVSVCPCENPKLKGQAMQDLAAMKKGA